MTIPVSCGASIRTLTNATGLPVAGITASTSAALGVGSVELGHASDTTLSRASAGRLAIEGVNAVTTSSTDTLTNKTYDTAGTGNSFKINGTAITAVTGTGSAVLAASPALTGSPTAPTQSANDNSTKIATTAYVDSKSSGTATVISSSTATTNTAIALGATYSELDIWGSYSSSGGSGTATFSYSTDSGSTWSTAVTLMSTSSGTTLNKWQFNVFSAGVTASKQQVGMGVGGTSDLFINSTESTKTGVITHIRFTFSGGTGNLTYVLVGR
jgi:hypothetical protein